MLARSRPETRGRALLGLLHWVKLQHGTSGLRRLRERSLGPTNGLLAHHIASDAWYAYPDFAALLRTIDAEFGDGDLELCRDIGRWAGSTDMRSVLDGSLRDATPQRMVHAARMVWPLYYRRAGRLETVRSDPDDTRIRIRGFDAMDPAHCRLMEGWLMGVMEALGCVVAEGSREILCASHGDPYHEFAGTWTMRRR
ncbi:MAG: hypothetical protein ACFCGT_19505 [Sandaracinaceae bacterium]